MGAPLINLEQMIEDVFSVHIVSPSDLVAWRTTLKAVEEPTDLNAPIAMQTRDQNIKWGAEVSCGDFYLASYQDWVTAPTDFEMWGGWQTPAKAVMRIETTLLGNLKSLDATVAVHDLTINPEQIIDSSTGLITEATRALLLQVRGWGYERLLDHQIAGMHISLSLSASCGDFDVYRLRIRP